MCRLEQRVNVHKILNIHSYKNIYSIILSLLLLYRYDVVAWCPKAAGYIRRMKCLSYTQCTHSHGQYLTKLPKYTLAY